MDIPKENLQYRLEHLEQELITCEGIADKLGSGQMVIYENGAALPAEEMSKQYRHYAKHFRELIEIYKEELAK